MLYYLYYLRLRRLACFWSELTITFQPENITKEIILTFKRFRRIFLFLLIAVLAIYGGLCLRVLYDGRLQTPSSADAIIVLGAAAYHQKPSPVFEERIRHAVNLYKEGKAKKIIFTGGTPKAGFLTEAEVGAKWAVKNGVPQKDILLEPNSRNTIDNLKNSAEIARQEKLHTFIVVSDPYHMARAKLMAEDLGLQVQMSPTPSSRFNQAALPVKIKFFVSEVHHYTMYCILRLPQML